MILITITNVVCSMNNEDQRSRQELEERVTYCEHLVDTLNGVVVDLQKRVLALEQQNRKLLTEIQEQQDASRVMGGANVKPPHY